ncbi:hypothetical protein [Subtercola endophyticus]|uniref:hypothetical protein n=1 Tax=Subtercola endophyticus TaxID=2895559 RepID=UPI001E558B5F|nr:hypothetical protein [Subtercola endophyticus]UFS57826.1 hypothetical protein LQ955_12340 [Subtercola endophyticus]
MSSRAARTLRGLTAAGVAVFVAALSHALGGGEAPGGIGVVLALAFSAVVCVALAGKTLSLVRLSLAVGFSQLAFHLLFSIGAGGGSSVTAAGASGGGSGAADALQSMSGMSGMSGMGAAGMSHGTSLLSLTADNAAAHAVAGATVQTATAASTVVDPWALVATLFCGWMWVAHVAAAAVTVAALHRGGAAAAAALESARLQVRRLVQLPFVEPLGVPHVEVAHAARTDPDHPRALEVLIGRLRHRGPPVWQFAQP